MAHECPRDGTPALGMSCCYWHLKASLISGRHLTEDELDFVGLYEPRPSSGGWRDINASMPMFELTDWEIDTQAASDIAAIMSVGTQRDRTEFFG